MIPLLFQALERVLEYIKGNPQEAEWEIDANLDNSWPTEGCIDLEDYETRYRAGLDFVLRGISMKVDGQMKVGICGRTGAGKSSLTLALFRIIGKENYLLKISPLDGVCLKVRP